MSRISTTAISSVVLAALGGIALAADRYTLQVPNGLAFSPDERYLYVGDWDPEHKVVMFLGTIPPGFNELGHHG